MGRRIIIAATVLFLLSPPALLGVSALDEMAMPRGRVLSYSPGSVVGAASLAVARKRPRNALIPDKAMSPTATPEYVSLGEGGSLYLVFEEGFADATGPDIRIVESTWGTPEFTEKASVYASADFRNWTYLGVASNEGASSTSPYTVTQFDLSEVGVRKGYVIRLDDFTNSRGADYSDGFDVSLVQALHPLNEKSGY